MADQPRSHQRNHGLLIERKSDYYPNKLGFGTICDMDVAIPICPNCRKPMLFLGHRSYAEIDKPTAEWVRFMFQCLECDNHGHVIKYDVPIGLVEGRYSANFIH